MNKIDFYSYEQQDEFIVNLFKQKKDGFFIDVACGHPMLGNNTFTLDSSFNWKGFCFELSDVSVSQFVKGEDGQTYTVGWKDIRNNPFVSMDATSQSFTNFLMSNIPEGTVVDYISLDVDAAGTNLALPSLRRILDAGVKFKAMTFEHEIYLNGHTQPASVELLEGLGYRRLFRNVRLWGGRVQDDIGKFSEDWWINPEYFDEDIFKISMSEQYFFECVKALKEYVGADYQGHHHCCQAYATEVDRFATHGAHGYHTHAIRSPGWKSAWE